MVMPQIRCVAARWYRKTIEARCPSLSARALAVACGLLALLPSVAVAQAGESAMEPGNILGYLTEGGPVVMGTLALLVGLSLGSWSLIGIKLVEMRAALKQTRGFLRAFDKADTFSQAHTAAEAYPGTPLSGMVDAAARELEAQRLGGATLEAIIVNVHRALRRSGRSGIARLETRLGFLATVASAAPFIGLFGTVWGIMNAFAYIRPDQPILTTVAPHIAHALVATAAGLATAIPAVMAYNHFVGQVRYVSVEIDGFIDDILNRIGRSAQPPATPSRVAIPVAKEGKG